MTDKAEPLFPVAAGFVDRHCGIDEKAEREMLAAVGVESLEDLGRRAIPESIFVESAPDIGAPLSEIDALNHLRAFAEANQKGVNMIGMGYYGTRMPSVVIRRVLENPGFYTAYTPYQAEIAQGRLEMLLNFQTMIADLTALPIANSSLLDEATAAAEAMALLYRAGRGKSKRFLVDENLFPQTLAVIETRARHLGWEIAVAKPGEWENLGDAFGAIIGYPGGDGATRDWREVVARLRENKIPAIAATDLLALTLLAPPGEMGFAAAIGSSQRFGIPPGFGGPHAGFLAVAAEHQRAMPGASSACRATRTGGRGCGSLCKRASNTFAAKKRRATFARRRFCRRFCRSLSRFITAPAACAESRLAPPASPPRSRRGWSKWDTPRATASVSTLCASTASKPTLSRRGLGTIRALICCANRRRQSASASIN